MDKLRNILDTIYNTEHGMLYFYLILGAIALIFVVLIIITIVKAKKEDKILKEVEKNNPALKSEPQEEVKEPVKVELKEEPTEEIKEEQEEYEPEYYSETQIFNKVLMDTNNYNNNEDLTPSPVQNEEIPLTIPETNELNKPETNDSVYLEPVKEDLEDKSIGELFTEELPVIYPEMTEEELNKEETQEETPVIQDTPVVPEKPKEEKEENKELTNTQSIHISNDEIKARLAKLKNLKKEEPAPAEKEIPLEQSDTGLINIMSNAGINDDMELPAIKEARNTEEIDTNKTI
ncbi:MAG: hypothetical protein SO009_04855 [Bacilli bacterium]|nr:hypothetical protein [Bacilli bacterium]